MPAPLPTRRVSNPRPGAICCCRDRSGLGGVLFGIEATDDVKDLFLPGRLPQLLPDGVYRFANEPHDARLAALAVALGSYRFTRYRKSDGARRSSSNCRKASIATSLTHIVEAVTLARDLINTPANDMGPAELEDGGAQACGAVTTPQSRAIVGDDLLTQNFPLIHAVGRAAAARRAAADRHDLGRRQSSARDAGRQGRLLRYRRPRHQARHRHAQHEEGHGRRGDGAGARAHDHGART